MGRWVYQEEDDDSEKGVKFTKRNKKIPEYGSIDNRKFNKPKRPKEEDDKDSEKNNRYK